MNGSSLFLSILSAVALLMHLEANALENVAQTVNIDGAHASPRQGFLERARQPRGLVGRNDPLFDHICKSAEAFLEPLNCPLTLTERVSVRNFLPPPIIAADLPHLRLDIVLNRMEHQAVSDGGVTADPDPVNFSDDLYATWRIQSAGATAQFPDFTDPDQEDLGLPVPQNPGEVWDNLDHANLLYQGVIRNGCSTSTVFDVELVSAVIRLNGMTLGEVQLQDEVVGSGFYVFSYTIRATDPNGGVSDFIFSGDARAYCTSTLAISP